MLRAIKILGYTLGVLCVLTAGAAAALFFSENALWVPLSFPYPQLSFDEPFGVHTFEVLVGVAAAGWLLALGCLMAAFVLLPLYLRRSRQLNSMIKKLERELVALRNLPFQAPAPLEDLPDAPVRGESILDDDGLGLLEDLEPEPESGVTSR